MARENRALPGAWQRLAAARTEAEWRLEPLLIPDRDAECWEPTHPLAQIQWTWNKNRQCKGHYVNVVKAIKWWRRVKHPKPEYPKGYPVEHLVGVCCPDNLTSVAQGVTRVLENIAIQYQAQAVLQCAPCLPDHGVPEHNVLRRITGADFAVFHAQVCQAAAIARRAYDADNVQDSANAWWELFGDKFPRPPSGGRRSQEGGYTERTAPSILGGGRFA